MMDASLGPTHLNRFLNLLPRVIRSLLNSSAVHEGFENTSFFARFLNLREFLASALDSGDELFFDHTAKNLGSAVVSNCLSVQHLPTSVSRIRFFQRITNWSVERSPAIGISALRTVPEEMGDPSNKLATTAGMVWFLRLNADNKVCGENEKRKAVNQ